MTSEFEAKVAKFARRVWEVHDKYIESLIAFNKGVHEERCRRGSETPDSWYDPWEIREKSEREWQRIYCLDAIKDYRDGLECYRESKDGSVLQWWSNDIVKIPEPLIRRQPEDFTIGYGAAYYSVPAGEKVTKDG